MRWSLFVKKLRSIKIPKRNLKRFCIMCTVIVSMLIIIFVYVNALNYTFFYTDDYSHSGLFLTQHSSIGAIATLAFEKTVQIYQTMGGTYSSVFAEFLLDPLCYDGFSTLHFWLIMLFCYCLLSVILCLSYIFRRFYSDWITVFAIISCVCWAFFNYKAWTETLFWFTGSMAYTMPFASLLYMFFFFMLGHERKKFLFYVLSFLFGILAMGGVLCVAFVGCYGLTLILIRLIHTKSIKTVEIAFYIFIVLLGAINALAPGNYARHALYTENDAINIGQALWYAVRTNVIQIEKYIKDTGFPVVLMLCFLIGYHGEKRDIISWKQVFFCLTIPVIAVIPAIIGYSSPYMPNRVLFIGNFFLIVSMVILALKIGDCVASLIYEKMGKRIITVMACLGVFITICTSAYRIENGELYMLAKAESNGALKTYYQGMLSIDTYLRDMKGRDAEIVLPEPVEGFLDFWLEEDDAHWVNREVASYYGNTSIKKKQ